jgi:allantoicase
MDGWEPRRKRGPGHDWCIVRLGLPGRIAGVNVDTAHFLGNFPEYCSIEACSAAADATGERLAQAPWQEILPKTRLQGGTCNLLPVASNGRWTHLRLNIFPDGGVARLRVHGIVEPDWAELKHAGKPIDLAGAAQGGVVVTCNDMFFGHKDNLLFPGRARHMGEGWETRRKRGPGHDWIIVKLGASGRVNRIEVDTHHFKGNFPESCSIDGLALPGPALSPADFRDRKDLAWKEILPRTKLQAHHQHFFDVISAEKIDYVRLNIYPDGGVSRLRVYGTLSEGGA